MLAIAQSMAPLILIIVAGVITGRSSILPDTMREELPHFCFHFGTPGSSSKPSFRSGSQAACCWPRSGRMASAYDNIIMLGPAVVAPVACIVLVHSSVLFPAVVMQQRPP